MLITQHQGGPLQGGWVKMTPLIHLMCVPFEIASFLQLEFLRGRFATTG